MKFIVSVEIRQSCAISRLSSSTAPEKLTQLINWLNHRRLNGPTAKPVSQVGPAIGAWPAAQSPACQPTADQQAQHKQRMKQARPPNGYQIYFMH